MKKGFINGLFIVLLLNASSVYAQQSIQIAVASNFLSTLTALSKDFTKKSGIPVRISSGATGMLYAQIQKGAPYDLFFAADAKRPKLLEQQDLIAPGSRFTYVTGKLVAWAPPSSKVSPDLSQLKPENEQLDFMAIANPKTAPYGAAAVAVLKHYGLYQKLKTANKIAIGGNIGKTFQYAASGNAQIGLVAKSYVSNPSKSVGGHFVEIPSNLYPTLIQQAVVLKGKQSKAVEQFLQYLKSPAAKQLITSYGYGLG